MSFVSDTIKPFFTKNSEFNVSFIICGTQKGGTTALDYYLRAHHEICMANKKEVHFFDNNENFKLENIKYKNYHKYFNPMEHHRVIGEATPIYMYWENAIKRIHKYNPKMKLIMILRNPIKRAFSHWNMETEKNKEHLNFKEAIQVELSNLKSQKPHQNRIRSYLARGLYSKQIKQILECFKMENLLIIQNEKLRNLPNEVLAQISTFLSIAPFEKIDHKNIHSRKYKKELMSDDMQFLQDFYSTEISSLEELLGWDLEGWKNN